MTPERQKRALNLWRSFVADPTQLDVEIVDALLLRDELESTEVGPDLAEIRQLDAVLRRQARQVLAALDEHGLSQKVRRVREARGLESWWWWLDRFLAREPIALAVRRGVQPRAERQARQQGQHDEPLADFG